MSEILPGENYETHLIECDVCQCYPVMFRCTHHGLVNWFFCLRCFVTHLALWHGIELEPADVLKSFTEGLLEEFCEAFDRAYGYK